MIHLMKGPHAQNTSKNRNSGATGHVHRRALRVDANLRALNLKRLKRIEGQVRGVHRMVEEDRYCAEIMIQIAAINEALRAVARKLLQNHLRHCATIAIRSGSPSRAEKMYEEVSDLFAKFAR
jgi:DNA-binding FrmR family transcriptional regulator